MSEDQIKQIIARLDRLERAMFGHGARAQKEKESKNSSREGLPAKIFELRAHGFFREPKTAKEVHSKLQQNYYCELDRVTMALLRIQRRKELRKSSKMIEKKKQVAYTW